MFAGVQFSGQVSPNASRRWFTSAWPAGWYVIWNVVPVTPNKGAPQVEWRVEVERTDAGHLTYWITVRNLTAQPVGVEGRFIVVNQEG